MKPNKFKSAPVIVKVYPQQVHEADLVKELRIDKSRLNKELVRQPSRYAFWASLYSVVSAKVEFLKEKLEVLEANLFLRYATTSTVTRKTDLKYHVVRNSEYRELRRTLRKWQDSERILKYVALKGFEQRQNMLQTLCANRRKEWDSEVKTSNGRKSSD